MLPAATTAYLARDVPEAVLTTLLLLGEEAPTADPGSRVGREGREGRLARRAGALRPELRLHRRDAEGGPRRGRRGRARGRAGPGARGEVRPESSLPPPGRRDTAPRRSRLKAPRGRLPAAPAAVSTSRLPGAGRGRQESDAAAARLRRA